ncbi:gfo/Idh/MocA family oxidoreductase [Candidatus Bathyarchaeota archaeon]|nr:MAG: gfo/Idh/MocA family oxidoreductase [Candidatus Bathyarchaeota archaeon]
MAVVVEEVAEEKPGITGLSVGFIGCGGIAGHHLNQLIKLGVKPIAFCDVDKSKALSFAERIGGATVYTDYYEMFDREELDAVWICIPPFAHRDEVVVAAENGVNVFLEKPIALDMKTAKSMVDAVGKHGVKSWVGYQWRQFNGVQAARMKLVREGGRIGLVEGYWWGGVPGAPWWIRREFSGGQVVEQTTHIFDLARYLCGEVERVYTEMDTLIHTDIPGFDIEDVGVFTLRFKNGAVGVISNTSAAQPPGRTVGLRIVAKNLQVEVSYVSTKIHRGSETVEIRHTVDPYLEEDRKFLQSIVEDSPTEVPIMEGLKTLAVTLAAVESWRRGSPVRVEELLL